MQSDFRDDLLSSYSEAELVRYITASPSLEPNSAVRILSPNLLAKRYERSEIEDVAEATEVAGRLGIRVPCTKKIVMDGRNAYCIMDYVEGVTLEVMWTKLGWFMTVKLALQLHRFVKLLRSVTSSTAGSLVTGECRSFWLEDRYGLPAKCSPENITSFLQFWVNFTSMRKAMQTASGNGVMGSRGQIPPTPKTLVLTHHDLAPRNLLLAPSGDLWLLDWEYAGFYPIYFEYASMQNFNVPQNWGLFARLRWQVFSWIAVGCYEYNARMPRLIRSRFTRFAVGRRFEL